MGGEIGDINSLVLPPGFLQIVAYYFTITFVAFPSTFTM